MNHFTQFLNCNLFAGKVFWICWDSIYVMQFLHPRIDLNSFARFSKHIFLNFLPTKNSSRHINILSIIHKNLNNSLLKRYCKAQNFVLMLNLTSCRRLVDCNEISNNSKISMCYMAVLFNSGKIPSNQDIWLQFYR